MPVDYLAGLGKLPDPMGDINRAINMRLGQQQAGLQIQQAQMEMDAAREKQERVRGFETSAAAALQNPTAGAISDLMIRHPEYADELKKGWDVRDDAVKQRDLTQLGEIFSAGNSGRFDLAAKAARRRYDADLAAGQADESDLALVTALESDDPAQQKAALGMIGVNLAAATGPTHFGSVYGALNKKGEGFTLDAGAVRFDGDGNVIAQSPYLKGANNEVYERTGGASGAQASVGSIEGPQGVVASTLATSGMSAPVIAGFLGNFEVEGGYGGAKGDGNTAHGIAQWRNERRDNFVARFGVEPGKASHEQQAQFVAWEMQNPEKAGMTVAQRDRILAAKTPTESAALIDQFYERSDGKHRPRRLAAANRYAGMLGGPPGSVAPPMPSSDGAPPGYRLLTPGKKGAVRMSPAEVAAEGLDPNVVYYRDANGVPNPVSGQKANGGGAVRMTAAEVAAEGLPSGVVYYRNKDGVPTAVSGQDTRQTSGRPIPPAAESKAKPLIDTRDAFDRLLNTWKPEFGGYTLTGSASNWVQGKLGTGPEGQRDWWADFKSMDNQVRNDLFGSALTTGETAAYKATTISQDMDPAQIRKNLARRAQIVRQAVERTKNFMVKNKFDPDAVEALFAPLGGSAPVARIRSVQEYSALPKGTAYIDPQGNRRMKR